MCGVDDVLERFVALQELKAGIVVFGVGETVPAGKRPRGAGAFYRTGVNGYWRVS